MSNGLPAFLADEKEQEQITSDTLAVLKQHVDRYQELEKDILSKEEELKQTKEAFNKLSQETIPEFLAQYGLSDITLSTGEHVKITEDLNVTITDENKQKFFKFLEARNEQDIIKLQVAFDKMENEKLTAMLDFLIQNNYKYDAKRDVHYQTMKAYFKELLGMKVDENDRLAGIAAGKYLRKEDIEDFANVFQLRKTKIK